MVTQNIYSAMAAVLLMSASGLSLGARAAASTPIVATATVSQACSITTKTDLVFGSYDPIGTNSTAALNATGQVSVACSKGASGLKIGIDNGTHLAGTQRNMAGTLATNLLAYNIFQPPSNSPGAACVFTGNGTGGTGWTNADAGSLSISGSPGVVARAYNVCGSIPSGQDATVDTYKDTVNATINF
jgi:spore coat protein U-like protein